MRCKKYLATILCTILLVSAFGGCGTETSKVDTKAEATKGSYVESRIELSKADTNWKPFQMEMRGEKLHVMCKAVQNEHMVFQDLELQDDSFIEVTPAWLSTLEIPYSEWGTTKYVVTKDGNEFLLAMEEGEAEDCVFHLYQKQNDQAVEVTPKAWLQVDENYGDYPYINGFVEKGNSLIANTYTTVYELSGEDAGVIKTDEIHEFYTDGLRADGENVYALKVDYNTNKYVIEKWNGGDNKNTEEVKLDISNSFNIYFDVTDNSTIVSANQQGIFKYNAQTQDWEKITDCKRTDFALISDRWCTNFVATDSDIFYALFSDGKEFWVNQYVYDPEIITEVTDHLNLYAVKESYIIQNAVALYCKENPQVDIEVEYALSLEDYYANLDAEIDYNDVYQKLNTKLMSDNAPDILVLDGLDKKNFIEKGLLVDIEDIVGPMEESGALMKNITGCYVQDGKRYTVPLQFTFDFVTGRNITEKDMITTEAIANYLASQEDSYMGEQTVDDLLNKFFSHICGDIIDGKALNREVLKEKLIVLKKIADNSGMVQEHPKKNGYTTRCTNIWDLPEEAQLAIERADGFMGSMFYVAMTEYIDGDFCALDNMFNASEEIAICTKSQYQDTAKDFIRYCLSDEIQCEDYYDGFPVNTKGLDVLSKEDRTDYEAVTSIVTSGGEEMFYIRDYKPEVLQKMVAICHSVDKPTYHDSKVKSVLSEYLWDYFTESVSVDETVDKIEANLKMYLAE